MKRHFDDRVTSSFNFSFLIFERLYFLSVPVVSAFGWAFPPLCTREIERAARTVFRESFVERA